MVFRTAYAKTLKNVQSTIYVWIEACWIPYKAYKHFFKISCITHQGQSDPVVFSSGWVTDIFIWKFSYIFQIFFLKYKNSVLRRV